MKQSCISEFFEKIDILYRELNNLAPETDIKRSKIRNEFSGLMVVSLAATYENCVKTILINYADFYHDKFSHQVERKYSYLNSRIKFETLKEYLSHFDGDITYFESKIQKATVKLRNEINKTYDQILTWRHSYAHTHNNVTSLNDAYKAHRYAKYVLYSFEDALIGHLKRNSTRLINVFHTNAIKAFSALENNCEIIMEKAEKDPKYKKQFENAWFHFLTAYKFKCACNEIITKLPSCSLSDLPRFVTIAQNSAIECQQASKLCSSIKKSID
ncbi:TPA: hypothetical protein N5K73_003510 [Enterobacter kobei]|nr:hypothetical protein [Enterobacter kobei]HCM9167380.1 hypothetical protein [Enterobacter kobei]